MQTATDNLPRIVTRSAASWKEILTSMASDFTKPSLAIFLMVAHGWIVNPGGHTITRIYQAGDLARRRAHDAYHRFVRCACWSFDQLWERLARLLVHQFYPDPAGPIDLHLDDTLFHKTGRHVDGGSWWRDAVRSTHSKTVTAFGLNLLVLTIRIPVPWIGMDCSLPILVHLHRKGQDSLIQLSDAAINTVAGWFPHYSFRLAADGAFACMAGHACPRTQIISRLRRDAALFHPAPPRRAHLRGRPAKRGKRMASLAKIASRSSSWTTLTLLERGHQRKRKVHSFTALWYRVCGATPIRIVISRAADGSEPDDFFFTTDVGMSPETLLTCYNNRWAIEETFRSVKQSLGGQQPRSWKGKGPERASSLAFAFYSMAWAWYLADKSTPNHWPDRPWYASKKSPSFLDVRASLRRVLLHKENNTTSHSGPLMPKIMDYLIELLAYAA